MNRSRTFVITSSTSLSKSWSNRGFTLTNTSSSESSSATEIRSQCEVCLYQCQAHCVGQRHSAVPRYRNRHHLIAISAHFIHRTLWLGCDFHCSCVPGGLCSPLGPSEFFRLFVSSVACNATFNSIFSSVVADSQIALTRAKPA